MKKWQKISGLVALVVLAIVNFVIYGSSFMQTMYIKDRPSIDQVLSDSHRALSNVGFLVLANYLIIIFLFTCLWRKGYKR